MTATRYVTANKVILYCKPPCAASITIEHTSSVVTARRKARLLGWHTQKNAARTSPDRCNGCGPTAYSTTGPDAA